MANEGAATGGERASTKDQPLVVAVILNTNRRDDTLECLASLSESTYANCEVVVLDNASTDGSAQAIAESFPGVDVLSLAQNKGYAGNNNVGIAAATERGADWIFVLNEDTVFAPDCLGRLVDAGEANAHVGFVGPLVLHADEPDIIQSAGGVLDRNWTAVHTGENERDEGQFQQNRAVDWIHGCAIMARREMVEEIGVLDERFFYYWEETEWCLRARRHGWTCMHVPAARLWHKGVQREYRPNPNVTYYSTRNRMLMMAKHRAPITAWLGTWTAMLRTFASWSIRPRWRAEKQGHRAALWDGTVDFVFKRWGKRPA